MEEKEGVMEWCDYTLEVKFNSKSIWSNEFGLARICIKLKRCEINMIHEQDKSMICHVSLDIVDLCLEELCESLEYAGEGIWSKRHLNSSILASF